MMSAPVLYQEPAPTLKPGEVWPTGPLADALFTSDLSARREYTRIEVATAIRRAIGTHHGTGGCVAEVAAAYGEHPETAARRMRWARAVIDAINAPPAWEPPGEAN
jgi:hypothetical protein